MRTLMSVEIEIILNLGLPCYLSNSSMRCLENWKVAGCLPQCLLTRRTQADGAQSSRVPVPLLKDPYEAIRHAYLVGTDIVSEPFEDHVETEAPESPHTVASPTSLPDSTPPTCHVEESEGSDTSGARSTSSDSTAPLSPDHPLTHTTPTLVPILCRTTRMAVRVPPAMLPGLSTSVAEVAAMSDLTFLEDDEETEDGEEGDDKEDDEEMGESLDSNSISEDAEDEGPTVEDEDPTAGDKDPVAGDEGPESERPEIVLALRQLTVTTWMDPEDGIVYIDVPAYPPPAPPAQTTPFTQWPSGSFIFLLAHPIVPSHILSTYDISDCFHRLLASPIRLEMRGFMTELGARVEMQGGLIHDHTVRLGELSPALFERYDRDIRELFTRSIWRPTLAMESWTGQADAQRAAMWHAISDTHPEETCRILEGCLNLVFVDPEISTQADGAQSPRVLVPLPEDPYKAIRQAYLVGTDTKSEPFEDHVETEAPESPHTVAPPTSLPDSNPPTLVPILRRTARMAVRVPPTMSPGLSSNMAEVEAPIQLSKDEGPTAEDKDPAAGDDGLTAKDEDPAAGDEGLAAKGEKNGKGPRMGVEVHSLGGDDAESEVQPLAALLGDNHGLASRIGIWSVKTPGDSIGRVPDT
ncbi:hypothetical protein Tco_0949996 [Tanacetum coccineum]